MEARRSGEAMNTKLNLIDDKELLCFRWGQHEYGVAVENVVGIIKAPQLNEPTNIKDNPFAVLGVQVGHESGPGQQAILLNNDGIGIVLIVDEVLKVGETGRNLAQVVKPVSLTIWKFDERTF
jgi:hypothetical protein